MTQITNQEACGHPNPVALSAVELARRLDVSLRHIRRMDASGKLPKPFRLGRSVRWLVAEINEWLRAGAPNRRAWEAMK